jgi:kynureninase
MQKITEAAHKKGCRVGFDLAHGAGNLLVKLHDWDIDFAVWCSYKYLNGGPGTLGGCFIHERHVRNLDLPRFAGWWGHDKAKRFLMEPEFKPMPTAEAWQLSNPPIFQMAALRASMELFDKATMPALRKKSEELTGYMESLIDELPKGFCSIVTPRDPAQRGAQLSIQVRGNPREISQKLLEAGIVADAREPDIIRAAPAPLYCTKEDVKKFVEALARHAK